MDAESLKDVLSIIIIIIIIIIVIIIINPLTARVVGAPRMTLQPVFSIFPCSPLPSGICRTPGNWTTRRSPDHHKETQTAVVCSCLLFIRSGQNHLARHSERGKKTRPTEEEVGRQHQGMDRPGNHQVPEGSGEQRKMEKTGCGVICGARTTFAVKG